MTLEIIDDTFFMVQVPGEKTLHQNEDDAIDHLQDKAEGIDPESSDVSVVRISVDGGDWTIAEMSWQNIALRLMDE
jgi:hypothetical protein